MKNNQQAIRDIQAGKYVELDIGTAYELICKTQSLGADWKTFLEHAQSAVLHTTFRPCINLIDLQEYVSRELEKPPRENDKLPLSERLKTIFESAKVYLQRYDIENEGTRGKIFIYRTPTEIDFDRARSIILFVLEAFRQLENGGAFSMHGNDPEVMITIRGIEKFFDIKIKSGINTEAWFGFDFR